MRLVLSHLVGDCYISSGQLILRTLPYYYVDWRSSRRSRCWVGTVDHTRPVRFFWCPSRARVMLVRSLSENEIIARGKKVFYAKRCVCVFRAGHDANTARNSSHGFVRLFLNQWWSGLLFPNANMMLSTYSILSWEGESTQIKS